LLESAYDSNERQLKIVDDLLRVARVDAGQILLDKTSCDLARCISSVITEQGSIFSSRRQQVVFRPPTQAVAALVDVELMHIVFENLLDNASKYSFEGTTTSVELRQDQSSIYVRVRDKGVGIPKEDQQKLFQKFSRIVNPLSDTVSGTGLGLYWARKIVELHGGTLKVTSRAGKGSTFSVKLPIAVGATQSA
jgi:signal transduction histidine kinase